MNKKIKINEQCNGCGLCLGCDFIEETSTGKAKAAGAGILRENQIENAGEMVEACPEKAILLEDIAVRSKEEIERRLDGMPLELKLSIPEPKDFPFDAEKVDIPLPYDTGNEYDYRYSSYSQAIDAARDVIRRNMFSNRTGIVQDIIGGFLSANFGCYVDYKETEGNFYYAANAKAQEILDKMVGEVAAVDPTVVPAELKKIQTRPKGDKDARGVGALTGGLLSAAPYIIDELSGDLYSLQSYAEDADWDDMDMETTGAFGREKTVTKYCYKGISDAYRSIAKDLRSALGWSFREMVIEPACDHTKYIIEKYEEELIRELKQKADKLKKLL